MPIVVDASVTISWFFEAEQDPTADALWDEAVSAGIVVPSIWPYEVANRLGRALVAGDATHAETTDFFRALASIPTEILQPAPLALVDRMAETGLSAYDAAYLETAAARGLPLATLDRRLRAAAAARVPVLPEE